MGIERCALILGSSVTSYNFSDTKKRKHFTFLNSGISLAVELISDFYIKNGITPYLATDMPVPPRLEAFKKTNILSVESVSSITETLSASLRYLNEFDEIIVNPIQSIPVKQSNAASIVLSDKDYLKEDWTSVAFDRNNTPEFLFKAHVPSYGSKSHAFSGRLHCYTKDLVELICSTLPGELNDLGYLAYKLFRHKNYSFFFDKWLDLSHCDLKLESKMNIISSRSFHSLSYDASRKVITKKMDSVSSVSRIASYYNLLPEKASLYFPKLITVDDSKDVMSCSFEFISYPTLTELFLHEDLGIITWMNIAKQLKNVNACISSTPIPSLSFQSNRFCSEKLMSRQFMLEKMMQEDHIPQLGDIYDSPFSVCGVPHPPLRETFDSCKLQLHELEDKGLEYAFSHGDLCFNNILADPLSGIIKVIDPRISDDVGLPTGVLPCLYDLAKLQHSVKYLYDSIVNNLYEYHSIDSLSFQLKVFTPNKYEMINSVFNDVFGDVINSPEVEILTASLFLSMLPLHCESSNRMLALAIVGSSIINFPGYYMSHLSLR